MPDNLEALRLPQIPIAPDPAFASRLRARLERALGPSGGPAVSTIVTEPETVADALAQQRGVVPFLAVAGGRRAIEWYVDALRAELRGEPYVMADGRIGHSELWIAGGAFHVADESPRSHVAAPLPGADATVSLGAEVADVDVLVARAMSRGATLERPAADYSYGRNAVIRDPFGHRWIVSSPVTADRVRNGDAGFASLNVPDVDVAARFYAAVFGWEYAPGSDDRARHVTNATLAQGLWGGGVQGSLLLSYIVDDIDAAIARVRAAGGKASASQQKPYGLSVDCVDVEGAPFAMHQPAGVSRSRRALAVTKNGDLAYVTMHVVDSARARAFYAAVFGWDYTAGRFPDAWNVVDPVPMTGMSGGRERRVNVPVYRVDDAAAAVQRVREAGGTATDPVRQPYGLMADCTDDQGTVFYLGEFGP